MSTIVPSINEGTSSSLSVGAFPRALEGVVRRFAGGSASVMPSLETSSSLPACSAKKRTKICKKIGTILRNVAYELSYN